MTENGVCAKILKHTFVPRLSGGVSRMSLFFIIKMPPLAHVIIFKILRTSMFSGGIRAALSRRRKQRDAVLLKQFEEDMKQQECELETASQIAILNRRECEVASKINNWCLHDARMLVQKTELAQHDALKRQCEEALKIGYLGQEIYEHLIKQQNERESGLNSGQWMSSLDSGHRIAECPAPQAHQPIDQQAIQAQLAVFWAERAKARQEYRTAKARRDTMVSLASHGSGMQAQQSSPCCVRALGRNPSVCAK
jgi:hypothetical protein